ncbi:MAG TPA: alpha/beta fold hydrolase [Planctomycetota bacterium]|nr:alpha/beta fold hydrolase [Planctomycetota bacterium]
MRNLSVIVSVIALVSIAVFSHESVYPPPTQSDFILKDFHFANGQTLPELKIHYRTLGKPQTDDKGIVRNAILIMHGTTGSGAQFIRPEFAGALFGKGELLDAEKYFIILPDDIGHGKSSKPSDSLHAKFPNYRYADMVEAEFKLVTDGLKVNHLRLVMGTSMGGMHTWLWGETHPDFMDALMPLASLPAPISGRNRMWRTMISEAIRTDPDWKDGDYTAQPRGLRFAAEMLFFMGGNPKIHYEKAPTGALADKALDDYAARMMKTTDANDTLYAIESSRDYDPAPELGKIQAPLLAINTADDLINPPDLGILEREIKRVKNGRAILIPESDQTRGHGTHTIAAVWKQYLEELMKQTERP